MGPHECPVPAASPWALARPCAAPQSNFGGGGWAGCALAATTGETSSAILGSEISTRREPIMEELESVEVDELGSVEIQAPDEDARVYAWRVERLSGLGLSNIVASAVATFVDWHEIARLVERGCSPELALEIIR